jgi:hypothetical protein
MKLSKNLSLKLLTFILFIFLSTSGISCSGNAELLIEENAMIKFYITWPTKLIPSDVTHIAIFINNKLLSSYKKAVFIDRLSGDQDIVVSLYPGDYDLTILSLKQTSVTSSNLGNYSILTVDSSTFSVEPGEEKYLNIALSYVNISAVLEIEGNFYITDPIYIRFTISDISNIMKFSGGKLYFYFDNGSGEAVDYKTIYVGDTQSCEDGTFLSKVYPGSSGYSSESFYLRCYAKFTVSSDKIAKDFFDLNSINEIKLEISDYYLGFLQDGTPTSSVIIVVE